MQDPTPTYGMYYGSYGNVLAMNDPEAIDLTYGGGPGYLENPADYTADGITETIDYMDYLTYQGFADYTGGVGAGPGYNPSIESSNLGSDINTEPLMQDLEDHENVAHIGRFVLPENAEWVGDGIYRIDDMLSLIHI